MSPWLHVASFLGLLLLSAVFSGAETGVYSTSRVRLEAEAQGGRRRARALVKLLRNDSGLLITLLVGSSLSLELITWLSESVVEQWGLPDWADELLAAAFLTPAVFLFGELVPKDLFRRRPHLLLGLVAPFVAVFRWIALPVVWPLNLVSIGLERLLGLHQEDFERVLRREEMLEILAEGRRTGALAPHAEELVHNVLVLRHTPLSRVALPWSQADVLDLDRGEAEARAAALRARFTRLPVMGSDAQGRRVLGYVHQLDLLGDPALPLAESLRPLLELPHDLPLDRAVARLQAAGQRLALIGTPRSPKGIVSLMDLLATIASQPRFSQPAGTARIGASP